MTDFVRSDDRHFDALSDWSFAPRYHAWKDLRVHYIDEGPSEGPVMLLLHGMPTWAYLYRDMIPPLVEAGYRCIAPDHLGFGRSDKPTDVHWYTIARHTEVLTSLITALDLRNITLFCQDWGGPTGLAQVAMMPDRFERLVIMNTWLHHDEYEYSEGIRNWISLWLEGGVFHRACPDVGLIPLLTRGSIAPNVMMPAVANATPPDLEGADALDYAAYAAPYRGLPDEAFNGYRRFPLSIPYQNAQNGNAAAQALHYRTLLTSGLPTHFFWGLSDGVFVEDWGRKWAKQMNARFEPLADAGHFLQDSHGAQIVEGFLKQVA